MAPKPKVADITIKWKPSPGMVAAYNKTITRFVSAIDSVPDAQKGELHELLWTSVMAGLDLARFTNNLVEHFGLSLNEAAEISQHQHALAKMVMENARRLEVGITEAVWMHAGAPCEGAQDHEALNGKRFKIETGVMLGGKQLWPGSERGCKCVSRAVVPGFE